MNSNFLFELFECFRSNDEDIIREASDRLIEFYSTPESLPFLSSLYLGTYDIFIKESILVGITKALNDEILSKLNPEQLSILQNNLILMLYSEENNELISRIESFFPPIINKFQRSWQSLDDYLFENNNESHTEYFYIFSNYLDIKTNEDCDYIIEFTRPKLKFVLTSDLPINSQLSALCFILNISLKKDHQDFLCEFFDECRILFQKVCQNEDYNFLFSFIEILCFVERGLGTSEFTKQVCSLNYIVEYCLSDDAYYSNCINLRVFINESLTISETDPNDLSGLVYFLIEISKKFYSKEIDVQTQRIDDYFPVLKYIPIDTRKELCSNCIQNLIDEGNPASICAALSLFRGAVISGITFGESNLIFFMEIYNIEDINIKIIAVSTLVDVCEELSTDIEENMDSLLSEFCQNLISVLDVSYETRKQFVLSVFEVMRSVIIYASDFSDDICNELIESLTQYIQNGEPDEQYQALFILMRIIEKSPKIACVQEIYDFIFELLEIQDPNIKELCYGILMIYNESYSQHANVDLILDSISNVPSDECFVYFKIIGSIAIRFGSREDIKQFLYDQIQLILDVSMDNEILEGQDHRGSAIFSLFLIMTAFNDLIQEIFPLVILAIAKIIGTYGLTDNNVDDISKGVEIFTSRIDFTFEPETFVPVFNQIKARFKIDKIVENDNLFSMLYLMTNFVECHEFPDILNYICIALRRLYDLMKSDEKKDIEAIQSISDFIRTAFENCESDKIIEMGSQLVSIIYEQLTENQSSSDLECHLILILSTISTSQVECFDEYGIALTGFLINKMADSFPNTAKNIAYFVKNLADSENLMKYLDNNQANFSFLIEKLINCLTPECEKSTLMRLNDNIISALITIEKKLKFMQIDDFYSLILPYLPAITDSDEFFYIYAPLIDSLSEMNAENQDNFIKILIYFFSFRQSAQFLKDALGSERGDLIFNLRYIITEKLDSVDDSQSFVNTILNDDIHKAVFAYFLNYIDSLAYQKSNQNEEE